MRKIRVMWEVSDRKIRICFSTARGILLRLKIKNKVGEVGEFL